MGNWSKEIQALESDLLNQLKVPLPDLEALLEESDSHWHGEDAFYRFYRKRQ